jgi:chloramphenicol O-acetyltransferase type A
VVAAVAASIGSSTLPIAVQVHHAAADGFHVSRLVNEIQGLFDDPQWLAAESGLR